MEMLQAGGASAAGRFFDMTVSRSRQDGLGTRAMSLAGTEGGLSLMPKTTGESASPALQGSEDGSALNLSACAA